MTKKKLGIHKRDLQDYKNSSLKKVPGELNHVSAHCALLNHWIVPNAHQCVYYNSYLIGNSSGNSAQYKSKHPQDMTTALN